MQVYRQLPSTTPSQPTLLSIGNFDGVHLGHQSLIHDMVSEARATGRLAGALTFDPHPMSVLAPERSIAYLTSVQERVALLRELDLDFTIVYPFTHQIAQTPAREFVLTLLDRLRMQQLWVGPDFALGRDQEGDISALQAMSEELSFELKVVPHYCLGGLSVRSSRIRALLQAGDVSTSARLLGRPYALTGEVTSGAGRGHSLGYPTANLDVPRHRVVPGFGIYAGWAKLRNRCYGAAISIGVRPTFTDPEPSPSVEAYLLDFDDSLYGQRMTLSFVERLRDELRFESGAALSRQIAVDVIQTRNVLGLAAE